MNPTSLLIVQPTPFCNISCSYCYLANRNDRTRLSIENVSKMFERALSFPTLSGHVTVVWHGGEPLVMGTQFYEDAFARIRDACPTDLSISLAFQTNGTLIDEQWCNLFKRWNVGVGLSLDGPKHIHDAARKTRNGQGTYDKSINAIRTLQKENVPFYILAVLTKAALSEPESIFRFFEEHDIHDVGFNIEEKEGVHTAPSLDCPGIEAIAANFFQRFSELMIKRRFPIAVREFEEALMSIRCLPKDGPSSNQLEPFGIITIDVNGNVYTFSPELAGYSAPEFPTFAIGNIFQHSFEQLLASPVLKSMQDKINEGIDRCQAECKYFKVCGGGAPANKLFENGTFASTETLYCRLTKQLTTDFVLKAIELRIPYSN